MKTEVLIVGAGPVGLTMAVELARFGVSVRVVDKALRRTDQPKALVVWSRTLELLDRAGCGEGFVAAGMKVATANIVAGGKAIGRIELGEVATPHPYALMLPQTETERLLEEHLRGLGVEVERGIELSGFTQRASGVEATLRKGGKSEEKVESGWMIGCDGAHSVVRNGLRMVFTGDLQPSTWILADVRLDGVRAPGEIEVGWHEDGLLTIYPIRGDRYRVIADVGPSQSMQMRPDPDMEEVQALLDRRGPGGMMASDPSWLAAFHVNERKVTNYRSGRVFLAGDAAHVHGPAGGQGMNTGMQDTFNLAWKLALVCRGRCTEEPLLGSYNDERSAVGGQVLKSSGRMTSLAILRGDVKQSIRNHIASLVFGFSSVRSAVAEAFAEVSVEYPESALNAHGSRASEEPAEGKRAPVRASELPFGTGSSPRFAVCADPCDGKAKHAVAVLAGLYSGLVEETVRAPFAEEGIWVVRPDGYIALAARQDGWDEVAAYLERIGRRT